LHTSGVVPDNKARMKNLQRPRRAAFTLIELIVILVIIALMTAIIIPFFLVSKKRSQAKAEREELVALEAALKRYAADNAKPAGTQAAFSDVKKYLDPTRDVYKKDGRDVLGNDFGPLRVGAPPKVPQETFDTLAGIVDDAFWSPYR
jgi:type II secretory pathway pseudopilin PulG